MSTAMTSSDYRQAVEFMRSLAINDPHISIADRRAFMSVDAPWPDGVFSESQIEAEGVPITFIQAEGADRARVVLHFHGGAYVGGSPRSHRRFAAHLSLATGAAVALVDYRLAPEHPFPAAFEDALKAYRWLAGSADREFTPTSLIVCGDSAGGGLAAALLLALRELGEPLPVGAVLLSAWTDLALKGASHATVGDSDPLCSTGMLAQCADAYLAGANPRDPRASPIYGSLADLPPLLIHVGEVEVLRDDSVVLAEQARVDGTTVDLYVGRGLAHVWHLFADETPEGKSAIADIAAWIVARFEGTQSGETVPDGKHNRELFGRGSSGPDSSGGH